MSQRQILHPDLFLRSKDEKQIKLCSQSNSGILEVGFWPIVDRQTHGVYQLGLTQVGHLRDFLRQSSVNVQETTEDGCAPCCEDTPF